MRIQLHGLLRETAGAHPTRAAFIDGDVVLTYQQLEESSSRVAAGLRERGVARGDRVGLVLDRSAEYLVSCYAILKAGAAVVPLNPDTRSRILVRDLGHCGASAVLIDGASARWLAGQVGALPGLRAVVPIGAAEGDLAGFPVTPFAELAAFPAELDDAGSGDDELASIHYTSGTTGAPKGVMLSHRNLVANVRSIVDYLGLVAGDTVAMVLPFYYVYGNSVLHTHIAVGGTIAAVGSMAFPTRVLEGIARHRCTGLSGVPSTFARLLQLDLGKSDLSSLRYVTQAGAAMSRPLTERLRKALPGVRIFVMYGQTEASARLSFLPPEELDRKAGSAGKAIPGVTLAIVDETGRELPRGTVGEIAARGDNVMLGYYEDRDATARALRDGWLRTGDLARMDDDGYLFIVGRESELIKSGGHRISPLEIEEVAAALPEVGEAAAVGVADELLGEAILLCVVPASGAAVEPRAVLRACVRDLPRYKVPARVCVVDELPHGPTGKLQRAEVKRQCGRCVHDASVETACPFRHAGG